MQVAASRRTLNLPVQSNDNQRRLGSMPTDPSKTQKQRESGVSCNICERFYSTLGKDGAELCRDHSKHRASKPLSKLPDFDDNFQI